MLSGDPCTTNDLDAVGTPDVNAQWAQILSEGAYSDLYKNIIIEGISCEIDKRSF